jgi:hypothetical protein
MIFNFNLIKKFIYFSINKMSYNITQWDPVLVKNNNYPYVMVRVKPDEKLLKFAQINNNACMCIIKNSNSVYDNQKLYGTITDYYTKGEQNIGIVLYGYWYTYPPNLGTVEIYGLKTDEETKEFTLSESSTPLKDLPCNVANAVLPLSEGFEEGQNNSNSVGKVDDTNDCSFTTNQINLILLAIFIFLIIVLWIDNTCK